MKAVKVSGAFKDLAAIGVKVGGAWKVVSDGFVKVSGAWKPFFTNAVVSLNGQVISDSIDTPNLAAAGYEVNSDGTVHENNVNTGGSYLEDWITPTSAAGAAYEVKAEVSGAGVNGSATGSWLPLSSTRSWQQNGTTLGTVNTTLSVSIRRASDGTVLASASISLSATSL